jgi:hypothetical protein
MAADIAEQPEVFARLLDERTAEIAAIAAVIAERRPATSSSRRAGPRTTPRSTGRT